ncbi:hypothetical protein K4K60_012999 [Colletotrichum sp. SAR11_57]|nr:hypothetical protein K4K60_012999 [Colletotrichum sp. SAR11_57]
MARVLIPSLLSLYISGVAAAANIVYVTDLSIYTLLAPCAQTAISYNIFSQTYSACGEAPTDLQSCICTKNNNLAAITSSISKTVSYSCGSSASDDQTSVAAVISQYCNPDSLITFATPTTNIVTQYATDVPAFSNMAPCAQSGVSYAISSMTSLCPEPASLMAPCICAKNDNSARVSRSIASLVRYSCSNAADVTSAGDFYDAYCAMNKGTTAFPTPTPPPGDMTYYITALSQYSSLVPCAQSGMSDAMYSISRDLCPSGPKALASFAQTYPTAKTGTGSGTSGAQPTGTATSDGTSGGAGTSSSRPGIGIIIGSVIALVGALSIAGLVAFLIYRRRKKTKLPLASTIGPPDTTGKPELGGTMLTELPPKSPSMTVSQVSSPRPDTISPASAYGGSGFGQSPVGAELPGQGHTPPVPEMPANTNGQLQPGGQYMPPELQSHGGFGNQYGQSLPLPPELQGGGYAQPQGQTTPVEAHGQPVHQAFGAQQASYQVHSFDS